MNYMILDEQTYQNLSQKSGWRRTLILMSIVAYESDQEPGMFYIVKNRYNNMLGKVNKDTLKSHIRLLEEHHAKSRNQKRTGS